MINEDLGRVLGCAGLLFMDCPVSLLVVFRCIGALGGYPEAGSLVNSFTSGFGREWVFWW